MINVTTCQHLGEYRLRLTFSDGSAGEVDLQGELWGPVFEPLKDPATFAQVRVDAEAGTIVWPGGADLAPEFLYELAVRGDADAKGRAAIVTDASTSR